MQLNPNIKKDLVEFISDNAEEINNNDFELLYKKIHAHIAGYFTLTLLEAGIDPLRYSDTIYPYYLFGTGIDTFAVPSHIKEIDYGAFETCTSLKEVTFAEDSQLEVIHGAAFQGTALSSIILPKNLKVIGRGAFEYCKNLSRVVINEGIEGIKSIDTWVFRGCENLKKVTYRGSMSRWKEVTVYNWPSDLVVECLDGNLIMQGYAPTYRVTWTEIK